MSESANQRSVLIVSLLAIAFGAGVVTTRAASIPAYSMTGQGGSTNLGGYNVGWEFTTTDYFVVTHLGMWDQGADGNVDDHVIAIWDVNGSHTIPVVSGTLLTTDTSITSGANSQNTFRYHDIADFILSPGLYRISAAIGAGPSTPDGWTGNPIGQAVIPGITIGDGVDNTGIDGVNASYPFRDEGHTLAYLGPDFLVLVPEPSTAALVIMVSSWLVVRRQAGRIRV